LLLPENCRGKNLSAIQIISQRHPTRRVIPAQAGTAPNQLQDCRTKSTAEITGNR